MDTGGLAQMSYNQMAPTGLGVPGAGFASRGKGSGLKRLSVASTPSIAPISEHGSEPVQTPRTSRSHLLAGLRTQPKTPAAPASAPYGQAQHRMSMDSSKYAGHAGNYAQHAPHTAIGSGFPGAAQQYGMNAGQQVYAMPEQVLAPPEIDYAGDDELDPLVAQQLMATEAYLAQRSAQLQQQLYNITNGMQGMQGMHLAQLAARSGHQTPQTPMTPHMSLYYQQMQNGVSPVVQEIAGQPGVFLVYNPMTGQHSLFDAHAQQAQASQSPSAGTPGSNHGASYFGGNKRNDTPTFRAEISPPIESRNSNPFDRSISPPKKTPSPPSDAHVTPLPPPSANAFRRGHQKKVSSLAFDGSATVADGPKSAMVRPVGFPATPMTGTFGPGNARAGEHPVRQPRGPPPLEELVAAPTSKHEGSKNFATRQRRGAVRSLVRAGIERRGVVRQSSMDSNDVTTGPDAEVIYGVPSDGEESIASGSGSLSGRPSFGSLRAAATGAIGSEMKLQRERKASGDSASSETLAGLGKDLAALRMRSPMGMLGAGAKRVGGVY